MKNTLLIYCLLFISAISNAQTQEITPEQEIKDSLISYDTRLNSLDNEVFLMKRLKFSGYVQAQYQMADTNGAAGNGFAGGTFDNNVNNRFHMRRSRLKAVYENNDDFGNNITQIVMQVEFFNAVSNATSGAVSPVVIRDFYGKLTDPWTRWVGIKAGAMDKPFGYEVVYSSGTRETPERGRMSQILFPGEKDFGAQLVIQPTKQSRFNWFKVESGFYNGTGVLNMDFDNKKDWISKVSLFKTNLNETIKYSGGFSYLNGGHKYGTKYQYALSNLYDTSSVKGWKLSDSASLTKIGKSEFFGLDGQVSIDWPIGLTTLRGEYLWGTHGGTPATNNTPRVLPTEDYYQRNFQGAYFYLIQKIADTRHSILLKYDFYDPNTKVKGTEIGAYAKSGTTNKSLSSADVKYSTLGVGYLYNYDQNWKFLAYVDFVKNELTNLNGYKVDRKDNVLTLRLQYTFNKYQ